jgi:putative transposase
VSKTYQNSKIDTPDALELAVPEHVDVVMAEVAADMREGLLALAVGAGLRVMTAIMESDVSAVAGPKGKHDAGRVAVRHGHERGSVTLGGRRVPVQRPRVRAADGSGELPVPAYELFSSTEVLGRLAMEKMLAGLSSRRYGPVGLEPVGDQVTATSRSTSKSAVSRRFVAQTETALAELLSADLSQLDLVALMVDGCTSPRPAVWWRSGLTCRATRSRSRWSRARPRTPPWSPSCSSGCVSGGWM